MYKKIFKMILSIHVFMLSLHQFVQKKDPMYKDNKEDTAWTMDKFNDYINDHVAKEKGLDQDWVYGYLTVRSLIIILSSRLIWAEHNFTRLFF